MIKRLVICLSVIVLCSSFNDASLKGMWQYCGGMFNGKLSAAPTEYTLQRKYKKKDFEAFVLEPGQKAVKYETGNYELKADTCFETQTYCSQPSQTLNKTIVYTYTISNDTLKFKGTLPDGATVEEYWKKIK
ncbi:hypothetical protein LT679_04095 [Mucilaginibacter roseus]|uniref:DUF4488 domain-containing protein n=1 Tax=Mucilaginibacter roseus TaxID=1528868 RepID=A0ABS8TY24_9SPHI|nr:hypothetical protein [Mucilaginibacter roseus]MCD8739774.1 hypothetical protein [Mucilaginibacter roseus]